MDEEDNIIEEDIEEVIEDEENDGDVNLQYDMDDMDLENEGGDGDDTAAGTDAGQDDASVCFKTHAGSVFCCALEPTEGVLALSGGEDDCGYLWNTTNGQIVMECAGHKDSVTCAGFNKDGRLAATGDMSGVIKVWEVETKKEVWSFEGSDLEWLRWHPVANVLLGGTSDGDVWMWKVPSGDAKLLQGHGCPSTCGQVMPDGKRCIVGYEDGCSKVWDLKDQVVLNQIKKGGHGHTESVTCIDCHKDNIIALTGSVDGTAKLVNTKADKVVATFPAGPVDESIGDTNSVESVKFSSSQPLAAVGSLNGVLSIWDVPSQKMRNQCKTETGIVKVQWEPTSPTVILGGLDGRIQLWDARSGQRTSIFEGHTSEILDFDVSSDGNTIVSSSSDGSCRVFKVSEPDR